MVNDSLENMRQYIATGIARKDEQQIEQAFHALAKLLSEYVKVEYQSPALSKTHANLVGRYLTEAVENTITLQEPDVIMEGVKLIGHSAKLSVVNKNNIGARQMIDSIEFISLTGITQEKHLPVSISCVQELSNLLMDVILTDLPEKWILIQDLRKSITKIAKFSLQFPDKSIFSIHNGCLAPYYSSTNTISFLNNLVNIVNVLGKSEDKDVISINTLKAIEVWADRLYSDQRELFQLSVEKRSNFTFDIIHWIVKVFEILLVASNVPACNKENKVKLQRHAHWLIFTFTFVPKEKDAIQFVETFNLTEIIILALLHANSNSAFDIFNKLKDYLLSWGLESIMHITGYSTLEKVILGLSALSLMGNKTFKPQDLIAQLQDKITVKEIPDSDAISRVARELEEKAHDKTTGGFSFSIIDQLMEKVDQNELKQILLKISNILTTKAAI